MKRVVLKSARPLAMDEAAQIFCRLLRLGVPGHQAGAHAAAQLKARTAPRPDHSVPVNYGAQGRPRKPRSPEV
jgi:hypothetical protein